MLNVIISGMSAERERLAIAPAPPAPDRVKPVPTPVTSPATTPQPDRTNTPGSSPARKISTFPKKPICPCHPFSDN